MFTHEMMNFERDMYGYMPPSLLVRLCMYTTELQSTAEGVSNRWLLDTLGAVWMLARFRCEQTAPIRAGDVLELESTPRAIHGASYIRQVQARCRGREVASCSMVWTMVHLKKRCIVRPAELEALWDGAYPPVELPDLPRLRTPKDLPERCRTEARRSDCDVNGHLSSSNYADILCDVFGFWEGGPRLMRALQIDFRAEFLPGQEIILYGAKDEKGVWDVCGRHGDGGLGFSAQFSSEEIRP